MSLRRKHLNTMRRIKLISPPVTAQTVIPPIVPNKEISGLQINKVTTPAMQIHKKGNKTARMIPSPMR